MIKNKYKLLNYVKGGGFGDVFFARHIHKNYDVAIKFVYSHAIVNFSKYRVIQRMKKLNDNMKMKLKS